MTRQSSKKMHTQHLVLIVEWLLFYHSSHMNHEMLHACNKVNGRPKSMCVSITKNSPIESFLGREGGILLWYHFPYDAMYFQY